jgi:NAD(P)H dehydrogenase (quinone)
MKILMVISNPNPGGFNYALLDRAIAAFRKQQDEVRILDLYQSDFKPVLMGLELAELQNQTVSDDVRKMQDQIRWADALVFIYPLWWFDRPAILKGWCDRVLTQGFAFNYTESGVEKLLTGKKAMVCITAGGSKQDFDNMQVTERDLLLPMTKGTLEFCGVDVVQSQIYYSVATAPDQERTEFLDHIEKMAYLL